MKVAADSAEAAAWSTRKPPKGFAGTVYQGFQIGGSAGAVHVGTKAADKVTRKVSRSLVTAGRKLANQTAKYGLPAAAAAGQAAGLSVSATAATILAAALVGYGLGSSAFYPQKGQGARLDAALKNLLSARKQAKARLGRDLTPAENMVLYNAYKETVVRIKANEPGMNLRPGAG